MHLEVLVEEPSAEAALTILLPLLVPREVSWEIRTFSGKGDLLRKLPGRLVGYSHWPDSEQLRILVLADRDNDDCLELKARLEALAADAGLLTRASSEEGWYQVCNRIAVEELEAWFIGDPAAVSAAYPRVPVAFAARAKFRDPDSVSGGTWESLERLMIDHGYHRGGLAKVRLAQDIAPHMDPDRNCSSSFRTFRLGVAALIA